MASIGEDKIPIFGLVCTINLNEYDVISQDGKKIYKDNLEEVAYTIGIELVKDLEARLKLSTHKKYTLV